MNIIQYCLIIGIILMGKSFEYLERESPKLFWALSIGLATIFTSFDENSLIHNSIPHHTEKIPLKVRGGSDSRQSQSSFISGRYGQENVSTGQKSSKTEQGSSSSSTGSTSGNGKGYPGPRLPWGVNPGFDRSGSDSFNRLDTHQLTAARDWISDPSAWEDDERDHPLRVAVDFPYKLNEQGNPTLLVPNLGKTELQGVGKMIRVEFDQTASHIHHAPDFGIDLPNNFDMNYYNNLRRADKIAYAKRLLPRETIISYQNEIAKQLTPVYNPNTEAAIGIAGRQKVPT